MKQTARQLISFSLPITAAGIVPGWLFLTLHPEGGTPHGGRVLAGAVLFVIGLSLLISTIRLFIQVGKGTLAPWSPTERLVVVGPYRYTRNPMISGVLFLLLGEAIVLWSLPILLWALIFWLINTIYFILSEEPGLRKRFGADYVEYSKHVRRWIPRYKPWIGLHPVAGAGSPHIEIRRAVMSDLPIVSRLIREAALWLRDKGIDQWAHRLEPEAVESVRRNIEENETYLVRSGGEDIATFTVQWSDETWWGEQGRDGSAVYLHAFALATAWHARGVGAGVIRWIEDYGRSQGKTTFRLDCNSKNARLNQYYQDLGFRAAGHREVAHGRLLFSSTVYEKSL